MNENVLMRSEGSQLSAVGRFGPVTPPLIFSQTNLNISRTLIHIWLYDFYQIS